MPKKLLLVVFLTTGCGGSVGGHDVGDECTEATVRERDCELANATGRETLYCQSTGEVVVETCAIAQCNDGFFEREGRCVEISSLTGKQYYLSADGDDAEAGTREAPWKSLAKLQTQLDMLAPGDAVFFRRGDTFHGSLEIGSSGDAEQPILFASYGSGRRPKISGLVAAADWQEEGDGVWSAAVAEMNADTNTVVIDGALSAVGREPNTGWRTYSSGTASSLTDPDLTGTNWSGAQVVIRKNRWIIDRETIDDHTGDTLSFNDPDGSYNGSDGFGYFFQRDLRTLDQFGEWYARQGKLFVYFGDEEPGDHSVSAGTVPTLVSVIGEDHIVFDGLHFEGANDIGILLGSAKHVTLQNSVLENIGGSAIVGKNYTANESGHGTGLVLHRNRFSRIANLGVSIADEFSEAIINHNEFEHIGDIVGMSGNGDGQANAILTYADNATIADNRLRALGYLGIAFYAGNATVERNFISGYCTVKDDGAGIYSYVGGDEDRAPSIVRDNIVIDGPGNPSGSGQYASHGDAMGIYMDDDVENVSIARNTISHADGAGIYLHNTESITLEANLIHDSGGPSVLLKEDNLSPRLFRNIAINDNQFVATTSGKAHLSYLATQNDFGQIGSFDKNTYVYPDEVCVPFAFAYTGGLHHDRGYSLATWNSDYDYGEASRIVTTGSSYSVQFQSDNLLAADATTFDGENGSVNLASPLEAGKDYVLSLAAQGVVDDATRLDLRVGWWPPVTHNYYVPLMPQDVASVEFIIRTPNQAADKLFLDSSDNIGEITIEQLSLRQASIIANERQPRLLFNPYSVPVTRSLEGAYIDTSGNVYVSEVVVPAHGSVFVWPQ